MHGCFSSEGVGGGGSKAWGGEPWSGCKNKQTKLWFVNQEGVDCGIHFLCYLPSGQLRRVFPRAASHTTRKSLAADEGGSLEPGPQLLPRANTEHCLGCHWQSMPAAESKPLWRPRGLGWLSHSVFQGTFVDFWLEHWWAVKLVLRSGHLPTVLAIPRTRASVNVGFCQLTFNEFVILKFV